MNPDPFLPARADRRVRHCDRHCPLRVMPGPKNDHRSHRYSRMPNPGSQDTPERDSDGPMPHTTSRHAVHRPDAVRPRTSWMPRPDPKPCSRTFNNSQSCWQRYRTGITRCIAMPAAGVYLYKAGNDLYRLDTTGEGLQTPDIDTCRRTHAGHSPPTAKHVAFTRDHDLYQCRDRHRKRNPLHDRRCIDSSITAGRHGCTTKRSSAAQASTAHSGGPPTAGPSHSTGSTKRWSRNSPSSLPTVSTAHSNTPGIQKQVIRIPRVRIGIVPVGTPTITWAAFDEKQDQYFGPVFWTPGQQTGRSFSG